LIIFGKNGDKKDKSGTHQGTWRIFHILFPLLQWDLPARAGYMAGQTTEKPGVFKQEKSKTHLYYLKHV
jgi:hypothetical protein